MKLRGGFKVKIEDLNIKPNYKKAFNILMEYWDCLPDESKPKINERLKKAGV